jgi:predicted RNA binding protein YcfA (HicA-like mRNA interferase family)
MPTSSDQVLAGLKKRGFQESEGTGQKGTHRTYYRKRRGRTSQTVTVILGKREIPKGTLRNMARQLGVSFEEFMELIG